MFAGNIFTDTNFIISYIFFMEPEHHLTLNFFDKMSTQLFYSDHVLLEVEKVFFKKYNLIKEVLMNLYKIAYEFQNVIFDINLFKSYFFKENNFQYNGKHFSKKELNKIIEEIWNLNCSENELGFNLFSIIDKIRKSFFNEIRNNKNNFLAQFHKINKYSILNVALDKKLRENKIHAKDRLIIQDISEYHEMNKKVFNFISYDKDFCIPLKTCNFKFLDEIFCKSDIKRLTE